MNADTFEAARREAERFIEACNSLSRTITTNHGEWDWPITGTKETGAVKRASMDLSRALSALRRCS